MDIGKILDNSIVKVRYLQKDLIKLRKQLSEEVIKQNAKEEK